MKDVNGNVLSVGDEVVFVQGKNGSARIATGKVTKIYNGHRSEECSVDGNTHILPHRVMKLK